MRDLDKPAALFIAPDDYERYLDGSIGGYDLDMEPVSKRPRLNERGLTFGAVCRII